MFLVIIWGSWRKVLFCFVFTGLHRASWCSEHPITSVLFAALPPCGCDMQPLSGPRRQAGCGGHTPSFDTSASFGQVLFLTPTYSSCPRCPLAPNVLSLWITSWSDFISPHGFLFSSCPSVTLPGPVPSHHQLPSSTLSAMGALHSSGKPLLWWNVLHRLSQIYKHRSFCAAHRVTPSPSLTTDAHLPARPAPLPFSITLWFRTQVSTSADPGHAHQNQPERLRGFAVCWWGLWALFPDMEPGVLGTQADIRPQLGNPSCGLRPSLSSVPPDRCLWCPIKWGSGHCHFHTVLCCPFMVVWWVHKIAQCPGFLERLCPPFLLLISKCWSSSELFLALWSLNVPVPGNPVPIHDIGTHNVITLWGVFSLEPQISEFGWPFGLA